MVVAKSMALAGAWDQPGGQAVVAAGALALGSWLLLRSLNALRRRGAWTEAFWATLRSHARYRLRALPGAALALLALALLAFGLYLAYQAILTFYGERFGRIGS